MLEDNVVYKHINCRDVAFLVLTCYEEEGGLLVTGYWINVYMTPSGIIQPDKGPVTIYIQPEQIDNWKVYEE